MRVVRARTTLLGVLICATLAMGASAVGETAEFRVASEVDAHWRGAYDILVRPEGARLDLEATAGVVEPNFLGFAGHGGISQSQVDAIRAIHDVELAAPVGFVGYLHGDASAPVAMGLAPPPEPTLYAATFSIVEDDGLATHVVYRDSGRLLTGPTAADETVTEFSGGASVDDQGDVYLIAKPMTPIDSPVLAIDPAAEAQLLGSSASFLSPLVDVRDAPRTVGEFGWQRVPESFALSRATLLRAARTQVNERMSADQVSVLRSRPVIPLVVSETSYLDMTLSLDASVLGHPIDDYPPPDEPIPQRIAQAARSAESGSTPLGSSSLDLGDILSPLQVPTLHVQWPTAGSEAVEDQLTALDRAPVLESLLMQRPEYRTAEAPADGTSLAFEIRQQGWAETDGPDTEPAYRTFAAYDTAMASRYVPQGAADAPYFLAPLGTFDLADLDLPDDPLSYVPYGAWDPPDTTYVAAPDGTPAGPVAMRPRLDPAGLVTLPPLAVTDIASAALLRGDAPIDAVRVRVAGVGDFSAAARAKVEGVAAAISALGLDADVVAGSSRQPVDLYVPDYFGDGARTRDLGWVTQGWTTLGAATRVEAGLAGGVAALLALAVAAAAACAGGLQLMGVAGRRRDVATLRAFGWGRGRVVRWVLAEASVGAAAVLALAAAGWWLGGRSATAATAGLAIAATYLACAAIAGLVAVSRAGRDGLGSLRAGDAWQGVPRRGRLAVRGAAGYGLRTLLGRPGRTLARSAALAVAGLATAIGLGVVASTLARVGPTLLASALAASTERDRWALLAIVALAGLAGTLVLARLDERDRAGEARALRAAGWDGVDLRRARLAMAAGLAALAAVMAALGAWVLASAVPEQPSWVVAALATAACLALSLVVALVSGVGSRREGTA